MVIFFYILIATGRPIDLKTRGEVLLFLMEQNNLKQTDLAEELGGSDILKGKR